jgi:hypothetical protein
MIDWTNTDGFKDLPLLPSNLKCQLPENNMGERETVGSVASLYRSASFYHKKLSKIPRLSIAEQIQRIPPSIVATCTLMFQ